MPRNKHQTSKKKCIAVTKGAKKKINPFYLHTKFLLIKQLIHLLYTYTTKCTVALEKKSVENLMNVDQSHNEDVK